MSGFLIFLLLISTSTAVSASAFPDKVFAPYVDVMAWPTFSISNMYNQTGQKYYTLAFIISGSNNQAAWGGTISVRDSNYYMDEINSIRNVGGDVVISFGGANGTELAMAITDVSTLQVEYQLVINKYNLTWIDLDIEGAAVSDQASIDRRNKAIAGLQAANPGLKVAYCLPVLPSGLTQDGLNVIQNAKQNGVRVDLVNVMAMDFGDWAAPNPDGKMGQYAIDAANHTHSQLDSIGVSTEVGVTPMIGQNDAQSERFYLSDASQLVSWANGQSWVTFLAFWSANRDNGGCPGGSASPSCSGISQDDFAFTNIFKSFTTGGGGNIWPTVSITSPSDGATFTEGDNITVSANASDSDGSVTKVEFFQGSTSLGVDTSSPYSVTWNNVPAGSYTLKAVATDNDGASTTSSTVSITVNSGGGTPAWAPYTSYAIGDLVTYNGKTYQCIQAHTSLPGWEPPNVPALWKEVTAKRLASGEKSLPSVFTLDQNYPNPFNPITSISYTIPHDAFVTLKVYNVVGKLVTTLVQGRQSSGHYSVFFDASKFESGIYLYRLQAGSYSAVKKMLLVK